MIPERIIADTDLLVGYLIADGSSEPALKKLMASSFCYTTVVSAAALFGYAATARQRQSVYNLLGALKILGINARSAVLFGELRRSSPHLGADDCFIAGLAIESRLPLCTFSPERFSGVRNLRLYPASGL
ncbi:MAG TPA: PIN domain-containing protein [Bacteroidota bacterium]|nr:PIN domain-containing protein [Bacteroidota bacterium]